MRPIIYFCLADPTGFSGQKAATEIVLNGLIARDWRIRRLPQPVYNRNGLSVISALRFIFSLFGAWGRSLSLLTARLAWLHLSMGQTRMAFVRDSIPLLIARLSMSRERIILALNGSPFMRWESDSIDAKIFILLIRQSGRIIVVGEQQRRRLIDLGISPERVLVITNTAVLEAVRVPLPRQFYLNEPMRLLHLSSLIDTKGFTDYLEALALLGATPGLQIDAVLCGKVVVSEFAERFHDESSATEWIEHRMSEINQSSRVRVRWIRGANGVEKTRLYEEADIFVLPTRYAVEAQPLVLLEAMSVGCAIITTRIGEIETILDEDSARFVESGSIEALAATMADLVEDSDSRQAMSMAAAERFHSRYALEKHLDAWESLLNRDTTG